MQLTTERGKFTAAVCKRMSAGVSTYIAAEITKETGVHPNSVKRYFCNPLFLHLHSGHYKFLISPVMFSDAEKLIRTLGINPEWMDEYFRIWVSHHQKNGVQFQQEPSAMRGFSTRMKHIRANLVSVFREKLNGKQMEKNFISILEKMLGDEATVRGLHLNKKRVRTEPKPESQQRTFKGKRQTKPGPRKTLKLNTVNHIHTVLE